MVYHVKTEDFYRDTSSDMQEWFNTSGYEASKSLI